MIRRSHAVVLAARVRRCRARRRSSSSGATARALHREERRASRGRLRLLGNIRARSPASRRRTPSRSTPSSSFRSTGSTARGGSSAEPRSLSPSSRRSSSMRSGCGSATPGSRWPPPSSRRSTPTSSGTTSTSTGRSSTSSQAPLLVLATLACAERPTIRARRAARRRHRRRRAREQPPRPAATRAGGVPPRPPSPRGAASPPPRSWRASPSRSLPWVARNDVAASAAPRSRPTPGRSGRRTTRPRSRRCGEGTGSIRCPNIPGAPPGPQDAADRYARTGQIVDGRRVRADAVLPAPRRSSSGATQPGREGRSSPALAVWGFWSPMVGPAERALGSGSGTSSSTARQLDRAGLVPRAARLRRRRAHGGCRARFLGSTLTLLAYETLMAMVFTGATRYRVAVGVSRSRCSRRRPSCALASTGSRNARPR